MRKFYCQCGQRVFFDSSKCVACGSQLGFDPVQMKVIAVRETGDETFADAFQQQLSFGSQSYRFCSNKTDHDVCNWLKPADETPGLCMGCSFNRTIPNLERSGNLDRWRQFEMAKKRLFFTLLSLGLPLRNGFEDPESGLLMDFIEDQRSAPGHYPETFVTTGFNGGVITINAMEADDSVRESIRMAMNESYRTLLGHLRHESGHYYWSLLSPDSELLAAFTELFGDPGQDYQAALEAHYENGPRSDWQEHFISAYASSHPLEDWAESWAHYLLIHDALETAYADGLVEWMPLEVSIETRVQAWADLSVALNEINRSSGLRDAYPFVVTADVTHKVHFIDEVVNRLRERNIQVFQVQN